MIGLVQGVFYRASALEQAQGLNLSGWIKNLAGGEVEIEVEGSRYAVEQFVKWCQRGPAGANVKDLIIRWSADRGEFRTFRIVR